MTDNPHLKKIKKIIEVTLMKSSTPCSIKDLQDTTLSEIDASKNIIIKAILELTEEYKDRGFNLTSSSTGYRFTTNPEITEHISILYAEKSGRYSKALLETLSIIAYKQPVTRGEIEEIRGVAVGSQIIKTLQEKDWIKTTGRKDVPGRPELFGTTKTLLNELKINHISELPEIDSFANIEIGSAGELSTQLELEESDQEKI